MAKFALTDVSVIINSVDLSDWAFNIDTPFTRDQIDVSGFNPTGTREFLPGVADQTVTIQFRQDFGATKVHQTIYPLFESGTTFPIAIRPDSDSGTSATNPVLRGTATLFDYNGLSGALNDVAEMTVNFKPAANSTFAWGSS